MFTIGRSPSKGWLFVSSAGSESKTRLSYSHRPTFAPAGDATFWVIHRIIIVQQVYLQIFMTDNSSVISTGGGEKLEFQRRRFPRNKYDWWQWEEYQFDINFNVNMSRASGLGIHHNGTWRSNEDTNGLQYMSRQQLPLHSRKFTGAF